MRRQSGQYRSLVLSLFSGLIISACNTSTAVTSAPTKTPHIPPVQSASATTPADAKGMSAEATRYLIEVLDYLETNSVMHNQVDWEMLRSAAMTHAANAQTTQNTYPAIRFAIQQLGDHHSFFLDPAEAQQFTQGFVKNLGFVATYPRGILMYVASGSPAELGGLQVGDILEQVNGEMLKQDQRRPVFVAINQTTQTTVAFKRAGQNKLMQITLDPAEFVVEEMPTGSMLFNDMGYLKLPQLVGSTSVTENYAAEAQRVITSLDQQGACGWIVDLRQNRGGNAWPMLTGIGPLLGEGEVGAFVDRNGNAEIWAYHNGQALLDNEEQASVSPAYSLEQSMPPVAILTGPLTASSAEFIAIAFRGRPNTRSFGEPTTGVPTANSTQTLSDGAMLFVTAGWEADRTGEIYKDRISPDQLVKIEWHVLGSETDPVIQVAADCLKIQANCSS
jgi:carboxyl-terminal processing protease